MRTLVFFLVLIPALASAQTTPRYRGQDFAEQKNKLITLLKVWTGTVQIARRCRWSEVTTEDFLKLKGMLDVTEVWLRVDFGMAQSEIVSIKNKSVEMSKGPWCWSSFVRQLRTGVAEWKKAYVGVPPPRPH